MTPMPDPINYEALAKELRVYGNDVDARGGISERLLFGAAAALDRAAKVEALLRYRLTDGKKWTKKDEAAWESDVRAALREANGKDPHAD